MILRYCNPAILQSCDHMILRSCDLERLNQINCPLKPTPPRIAKGLRRDYTWVCPSEYMTGGGGEYMTIFRRPLSRIPRSMVVLCNCSFSPPYQYYICGVILHCHISSLNGKVPRGSLHCHRPSLMNGQASYNGQISIAILSHQWVVGLRRWCYLRSSSITEDEHHVVFCGYPTRIAQQF